MLRIFLRSLALARSRSQYDCTQRAVLLARKRALSDAFDATARERTNARPQTAWPPKSVRLPRRQSDDDASVVVRVERNNNNKSQQNFIVVFALARGLEQAIMGLRVGVRKKQQSNAAQLLRDVNDHEQQ